MAALQVHDDEGCDEDDAEVDVVGARAVGENDGHGRRRDHHDDEDVVGNDDGGGAEGVSQVLLAPLLVGVVFAWQSAPTAVKFKRVLMCGITSIASAWCCCCCC